MRRESTLDPMSIITSILLAGVRVPRFLFATGTTITFMALIGAQIPIGVVIHIGRGSESAQDDPK